jgi:hypothetical protein
VKDDKNSRREVRRQPADQLAERFDATRGSADHDDVFFHG